MALTLFTPSETVTLHVQDFTIKNIYPLKKYAVIVTKIYADGHEHQYILKMLKNIPHGHGSNTWRGEWATFIAENLP